MLSLIVSNGGIVSQSLTARLEAFSHQIRMICLPEGEDGENTIKNHFEQTTATGKFYGNIFVDLTSGFNEFEDFTSNPFTALLRLERRLRETLKVLKYGAQHMARSDGGRIWALCYDHSVNSCVNSPANPITNDAVLAAVQSLAKEVAHFDVKINTFLIHPPKESVAEELWKKAKSNLNVYSLRYKPQAAEDISEILHMYADLKNLSTTGGVIPIGAGIVVGNI